MQKAAHSILLFARVSEVELYSAVFRARKMSIVMGKHGHVVVDWLRLMPINHILQQCIMHGVCVAVLYVVKAYSAEVQLDSGVFNCGGKVCTEVAKGEGGGR